MSDTIVDVLAKEVSTLGEFGREPTLPNIGSPAPTLESLVTAVRAIKQILDAREGRSGSVLDRVLTLRDLTNAGALQVSVGGTQLGGTGGQVIQFPGGTSIGSDIDPRPFLVTPPTPTNLTATGGFRSVFLEWALVTYRNHASIEVWRATTNSLGSAVKIGTSLGTLYVDQSAAAGTAYFYWVRAVGFTEAGGEILGAFNAISGTTAGPQLVGGADLSPLAVTAAALAEGAIDLTTNKVKATTNFGAIAVGYTVTQYLLATSGVLGNLLVDTAQIVDAAITNAKIASLAADKITAGSLAVGTFIQSVGYVAGTTGWRIHANGGAEFSGVLVRGEVIATAGSIGGNAINATGFQSSGYVAGVSGFRLNASGAAEFRNITARGDIQATAINIGSGTGARTEYRDTVIRVYDSGNFLRIKLGDLS